MATLAHVSDFLEHRHPYMPEMGDGIFTDVIDPHQTSRAFGRRVWTKLLDVLRFEEATLEEQQRALARLHAETSNQEKKASCIQAGGVKEAVRFLRDSEDATCRALAARLLASLVQLWTGRNALQKLEDGAIVCCQACADEDAVVRSEAVRCVAQLAFFRDGWDVLVGAPSDISAALGDENELDVSPTKTIELLTAALRNDPRTVGCLPNVSSHSRAGVCMLLAAGALPLVVGVLSSATDDTGVVRPAAMTLRNLATVSQGKTQATADGAALSALMAQLKHTDVVVRQATTGALALLLTEAEGKAQWWDGGSEQGMQRLPLVKERLVDEDHGTRANAATAVQQLFFLPAARIATCGCLICDMEDGGEEGPMVSRAESVLGVRAKNELSRLLLVDPPESVAGLIPPGTGLVSAEDAARLRAQTGSTSRVRCAAAAAMRRMVDGESCRGGQAAMASVELVAPRLLLGWLVAREAEEDDAAEAISITMQRLASAAPDVGAALQRTGREPAMRDLLDRHLARDDALTRVVWPQ